MKIWCFSENRNCMEMEHHCGCIRVCQYTNALQNLCCLNDDNEYSLHHSGATIESDERCMM